MSSTAQFARQNLRKTANPSVFSRRIFMADETNVHKVRSLNSESEILSSVTSHLGTDIRVRVSTTFWLDWPIGTPTSNATNFRRASRSSAGLSRYALIWAAISSGDLANLAAFIS